MNKFWRRRRPGEFVTALLAGALPLMLIAPTAFGRKELDPGTPAPVFTIQSTAGDSIDLNALQDQVVVLFFGQTEHLRSADGIRRIGEVLQDKRLAEHRITPLLVLTSGSQPETLGADLTPPFHKATVIHDVDRDVFRLYKVIVVPSVVVIDVEGKIVRMERGLSPVQTDHIANALLQATGQLTGQPDPVPEPPVATDVNRAQINRQLKLAHQLIGRGMIKAAIKPYQRAVELAPDELPPRRMLARLLRHLGRLDEAEEQERAVLDRHPDDAEAKLGLATIGVLRRGDAADEAEVTLKSILHRTPNHPGALYAMGLLHEQRGAYQLAAEAYRRAAEALLINPGIPRASDLPRDR